MTARAPADSPPRSVAAGLLAGCGEKREVLTLPATPTRLVVSLGGPPGAVVAPLYAGGALGDFSAGGTRRHAGPVGRREPGAGEASPPAPSIMAVASEPELLIARARGEQLVSIATLAQGPLAAADLDPAEADRGGRRARPARRSPPNGTGLASAELDTMLRSAGVEATSVRRINAGGELIAPAEVAQGGREPRRAVELRRGRRSPSSTTSRA